jgi:ABC-type transport system substrate-binding protein
MNHAARIVAAGLSVCTAAGAQTAQEESGAVHLPDMSFALARQPQPESPGTLMPEKTPPPRYGAAHTRWWTVGGGAAYDFMQSTDFNLHGAYTYFLADDVEFTFELGAWYFHQDGDDAFGLNPEIAYRWHFFDDGTWTIFGEIGIGLLGATSKVPDGGTAFDFMPRAGMGFTRLLDPETGLRLQAGARWHHISNARIQGTADNPGRDGLMLFAGLQFPF